MAESRDSAAILATPSEVMHPDELPKIWKDWQWRVSHLFGEEVADARNIFSCGGLGAQPRRRSFQKYYVSVISSEFRRLKITPTAEPRGTISCSQAANSEGRVNAILDAQGGTG